MHGIYIWTRTTHFDLWSSKVLYNQRNYWHIIQRNVVEYHMGVSSQKREYNLEKSEKSGRIITQKAGASRKRKEREAVSDPRQTRITIQNVWCRAYFANIWEDESKGASIVMCAIYLYTKHVSKSVILDIEKRNILCSSKK